MILADCWGPCCWLEHWIGNPGQGRQGPWGTKGPRPPWILPALLPGSRSLFQPSLGPSDQQRWSRVTGVPVAPGLTIHVQAAGSWAVLAWGKAAFWVTSCQVPLSGGQAAATYSSFMARMEPRNIFSDCGCSCWRYCCKATGFGCLGLVEVVGCIEQDQTTGCGVTHGAAMGGWRAFFALPSLWHSDVTQEAWCKVILLSAFTAFKVNNLCPFAVMGNAKDKSSHWFQWMWDQAPGWCFVLLTSNKVLCIGKCIEDKIHFRE